MRTTRTLAWVIAAALTGLGRADDDRTVLAPQLRAVAISASADGSRLAVLDDRGAVHLLDPGDGSEMAVLPDSLPRKGVAFVGPDASTIATVGSDVCVWNVAKAKAGRRIAPAPMPAKDKEGASHAAPENGFAFAASVRDKLVAVAAADRKVALWNVATDRDAGSIASGGVGIAAAVSADGSKFAALFHRPGGGRRLEVYDLARRSLSWRIEITDFDKMQKDPGTPLILWSGVAFSADGKSLFAKCGDTQFVREDGTPDPKQSAVRAYDLEKKKELWTRRLPEQYAWRIVCSPRDGRIALATAVGVMLLDPTTGATTSTLESPGGGVRDLAYSADGSHLFGVGTAPGVVRWEFSGVALPAVTEAQPVLAVAPVKFRGDVRSIAISPDGSTIAAVEGDTDSYDAPSRVRTYDLAKGTFRRETAVEKQGIRGLAFLGPDADLLVYETPEGRICVWSSASGNRTALIDDHAIRGSGATETYAVACLAASPGTREIAVGFVSNTSGPPVVAVLDATGTQVRARLAIEAGAGRPLALTFSADGLALALVCADTDVRLIVHRRADPKAPWDAGRSLRTDKLGGASTLWWHELVFTQDGKFVVARADITGQVAARAVIVIWRPEEVGDPWIGATAQNNGGLGLAASPRGDAVALSTFQGAVLVDPATGATILEMPGTRSLPDGLAFSPDGRRLYAALQQELVSWNLAGK